MTTLTIQEAEGHWAELVHRAFAGEEIAVSGPSGAVKLQPIPAPTFNDNFARTREALEWFRQNSTLTEEKADEFLREVQAERRSLQ